MPTICIVDYGVGNIHSAMKGLKRFTENVILSADRDVLRSADALVLPGQGAFASGMEGLRERGLLEEVKHAGESGKPILGICLGAQLLLERGFEFGDFAGLGFMPGTVEHFPPLSQGAKTPHMGWNSVEEPRPGAWANTTLDGLEQGSEMYFIHSYILKPADAGHILAETTYGGVRFASAIGKGNIVGCQFHPEKSGETGLRILQNFVARL